MPAISLPWTTTPARSPSSLRPPTPKPIPTSPRTASAFPSPATATSTRCRWTPECSCNSPTSALPRRPPRAPGYLLGPPAAAAVVAVLLLPRPSTPPKRAQDPRKPFTLQARQTVGTLRLTPDEKYVIASVFESAATPAKSTIVPNFITDSAYTEDIAGRSNVGDTQGTSR